MKYASFGKNVLQLIISNNWEKRLNSFANLYRIQNVFSEEDSSHFCRDDSDTSVPKEAS